MRVTANGYRVLFWGGDENVLKMIVVLVAQLCNYQNPGNYILSMSRLYGVYVISQQNCLKEKELGLTWGEPSVLILLSLPPPSATEKDSLLDCGKDKRGSAVYVY